MNHYYKLEYEKLISLQDLRCELASVPQLEIKNMTLEQQYLAVATLIFQLLSSPAHRSQKIMIPLHISGEEIVQKLISKSREMNIKLKLMPKKYHKNITVEGNYILTLDVPAKPHRNLDLLENYIRDQTNIIKHENVKNNINQINTQKLIQYDTKIFCLKALVESENHIQYTTRVKLKFSDTGKIRNWFKGIKYNLRLDEKIDEESGWYNLTIFRRKTSK